MLSLNPNVHRKPIFICVQNIFLYAAAFFVCWIPSLNYGSSPPNWLHLGPNAASYSLIHPELIMQSTPSWNISSVCQRTPSRAPAQLPELSRFLTGPTGNTTWGCNSYSRPYACCLPGRYCAHLPGVKSTLQDGAPPTARVQPSSECPDWPILPALQRTEGKNKGLNHITTSGIWVFSQQGYCWTSLKKKKKKASVIFLTK